MNSLKFIANQLTKPYHFFDLVWAVGTFFFKRNMGLINVNRP